MSVYPLDTPPQTLIEPQPLSSRASREKSAVREAITAVCEGGAGKLAVWMEKIEEEQGAKAAFDSFIKLLEFCQPKLSRVTVQDPDGNAPQAPIINVSFGQHPVRVVNDVPDEDPSAVEAEEQSSGE